MEGRQPAPGMTRVKVEVEPPPNLQEEEEMEHQLHFHLAQDMNQTDLPPPHLQPADYDGSLEALEEQRSIVQHR